MRGSADMGGMRDFGSRRSFFRLEIVCQDQPLEMKLESTSDFFHSEMRAARGPFSGMRSGCIVSLAFLSPSSVAAFRDPIPTAEMDCVSRPRGMHAKSSHQMYPIFVQLFYTSARIPRPRVNGA